MNFTQASERVAAYGLRWQQWCGAGVTLRPLVLAECCPVGLTDIFDFCPEKGGPAGRTVKSQKIKG
ncbi:hypothetical protein V9N52_004193 [Vibrio navarrensis]